MHYWLLKTEPEDFSWDALVAAGRKGETWDGIRNHQAAASLRAMQVGDLAFIYHTGKERRIVGVAEVSRAAFPDPKDDSGRFVAVTVRAREALPRPVGLDTLKGDPAFADFVLLRQSRLSAMPVTTAQWKAVLALAQG